jgi:hypothetical protein
MITSIRIENFRGIRSGELTDLKPLTILTGMNGCGKSSVLDALLIAAHPSPGKGVGQAVLRHPITKDGARWLVRQPAAKPARIAVQFDNRPATHELELTVSLPQVTIVCGPLGSAEVVSFDDGLDDGYQVFEYAQVVSDPESATELEIEAYLRDGRPSDVRVIDPGIPEPLHTTYTEAVRQGRKRDVLDLLLSFVPDVDGFEILTESDNTPALYVTKAGGAVPSSLSGDGVHAFLQLALGVAAAPGGLVLVEEPEVYQHPAAIEQTARVLLASMRRGVQTVVTTHSLELIDCLVDGAEEQDRGNMALYILSLSDGELSAGRFAGEDMAYARQQAESDLR